MSLRTRFILTFGVGGVSLLLIITILVFYRMELAMDKQLEQQFRIDTRNRIAGLNHAFVEISEDSKVASRLPMFRSMRFHQLTLNQAALKNDIRQLELYFFDFINQYPGLYQVQFINKVGSEIFRVENTGIRKNLSDMSQDKMAIEALKLKEGEVLVTPYRINAQIHRIVWWQPVYVSSGELYGVLAFSVDYQYILDNIRQLISSDEEAACLDSDQGVVFHSDSNSITCKQKNKNSWQLTEDIDIPSLAWRLTLSVDPGVFRGEVKQIRLIVFGFIFPFVAILGFILSLGFLTRLSLQLGNWLKRLIQWGVVSGLSQLI